MNVQFKKGVLDLCVLAMLNDNDRYGYELASTLSEAIMISDGTVYPLLRKLASDGLVASYLQESQSGPPRNREHCPGTGDDGRGMHPHHGRGHRDRTGT